MYICQAQIFWDYFVRIQRQSQSQTFVITRGHTKKYQVHVELNCCVPLHVNLITSLIRYYSVTYHTQDSNVCVVSGAWHFYTPKTFFYSLKQFQNVQWTTTTIQKILVGERGVEAFKLRGTQILAFVGGRPIFQGRWASRFLPILWGRCPDSVEM